MQINVGGSFYFSMREVYDNLYLNDLPFSFENILSDPFDCTKRYKIKLSSICWRFNYFSTFQNRLANCLNALASYCITWMLSINPLPPQKKQDNDFLKTCKKMFWTQVFYRKSNNWCCTRIYLFRNKNIFFRKF